MTLRHDVIHGEVPKRKRDTAAAAASLLFSEERVPGAKSLGWPVVGS